MKKIFVFAVFTAACAALLSTGCRKIELDNTITVIDTSGNNNNTPENTILEGRITANRTLMAQYTYKLGVLYM